MNPLETEVGYLGFTTEDYATFLTNAPGSRIVPFQIQNRAIFRAIRNRRFITLEKSSASCTIFQSLLRLAASCNFPAPFSRCCLPFCCFLPSKAERCMLCGMLLRSNISSMTSTRRIHRHADIVRLIHNWAAYLAALPISWQLPPFRAERYGLAPLHSVPTISLSPLRVARQFFSKKLHKIEPLSRVMLFVFGELLCLSMSYMMRCCARR